MMILQKIDITKHHSEIEYILKLYESAFPRVERRPVNRMLDLLDNEDIFNVFLLIKDEQKVGFITCWTFDEFSFVEHFAIDSNIRGKGLGKETLKSLTEQISKPILLEVEAPEDEMSIRRISFYESFGFKLWKNINYLQPPYEPEFSFIPLKLMTYRELNLNDRDFLEKTKRSIYSKVYDIAV